MKWAFNKRFLYFFLLQARKCNLYTGKEGVSMRGCLRNLVFPQIEEDGKPANSK